MVTKKGAGGQQQPYIPAGHGEESGEYTSFDSSCLSERIKLASDAVGYDSVVKYAYEKFEPHIKETLHVKERLKERGIPHILIAEALLKPLKVSDIEYDALGLPSQTYFGPNVTVCINPSTGYLITAHKTRRNIRNKFKE